MRFLTQNHVRLAIVPVLAFIALAADHKYLADFWHHLARGRVMVQEGRLLNHDIFTYTVAGQPFQDVNWLTQLAYHHLFEAGGLPLVRVANAAIVAAAFLLLVNLCWRLSGSSLAAMLTGVFTFFGVWEVLTIRPQSASLLLFVLLFDVLERSPRRPWLLCVPPLLLALWANLHGAFPAGIMLIGCFFLASAFAPHPFPLSPEWRGERGEGREGRLLRHWPSWRLAICGGCSLLATLVNPYGWGIYLYVGVTSNRAAARRIDEWLPPAFDNLSGIVWFISLLVVFGLLLATWLRFKSRPTALEVILMGCFLPLAASSVRMVPWWLLVTAPMLATRLALLAGPFQAKEEDRQLSLAAGLVLGAMALFMVLSLPGLQHCNPLLASRLHAARIEDSLAAVHSRLRQDMGGGRLFSRFEWSEYLGWAGAPDFKVFMDGRIEIIPDNVWEDYSAITCGRDNWQMVLDAYGVDALILDSNYHSERGLLSRVKSSSDWVLVFEHGDTLLYRRAELNYGSGGF